MGRNLWLTLIVCVLSHKNNLSTSSSCLWNNIQFSFNNKMTPVCHAMNSVATYLFLPSVVFPIWK